MSATDPVTLPDLKFQAMRALGLTGAIPEMTLAWLKANGATSASIPDAWNEMLAAQFTAAGISDKYTGHRADDWYYLLEHLGYATAGGRDLNQINERERLFWGNGGAFGSSAPIWGSIGLMFAYETGQDIVIDLNNYCFANPEVTEYTSDTGTLSGGPPEHILTITWADLGSAEGTYTVNLTATNAEGTTPWSFQAGAIAGAPSSKPQFDPVPNFYSTYGTTGGTEQPSMYAQDGGLNMNDYLINPPVNPGSWVVSAPQYVTIDANTGIVTGRIDTPVGTWSTKAGATNEVGLGWSNIFLWQVLPVGGWVVDFTSVDPDTLGGLTYTSTSETFNDYLAQPQTVGPNVPAMVGQEWDGSNYTQRGVSYGIQIADDGTALNGNFADLAGLPDGGVVNNFTVHFQSIYRGEYFSMFLRSVAGITPGKSGMPCQFIDVGGTNYLAVPIDYDKIERAAYLEYPTPAAGDLIDLRFRKRDSEPDGEGSGLTAWLRVQRAGVEIVNTTAHGTAAGTLDTPIDCSAPFEAGYPIDFIDFAANSAVTSELQHISVEARALDDGTITGWPTWEHPAPIIVQEPPTSVHISPQVPQPIGKPTISGTLEENSILTGYSDSVSDPDGGKNSPFVHNWRRQSDLSTVIGTGTTYTLKTADVGEYIIYEYGYRDDVGRDKTVQSDNVGPIEESDGGVIDPPPPNSDPIYMRQKENWMFVDEGQTAQMWGDAKNATYAELYYVPVHQATSPPRSPADRLVQLDQLLWDFNNPPFAGVTLSQETIPPQNFEGKNNNTDGIRWKITVANASIGDDCWFFLNLKNDAYTKVVNDSIGFRYKVRKAFRWYTFDDVPNLHGYWSVEELLPEQRWDPAFPTQKHDRSNSTRRDQFKEGTQVHCIFNKDYSDYYNNYLIELKSVYQSGMSLLPHGPNPTGAGWNFTNHYRCSMRKAAYTQQNNIGLRGSLPTAYNTAGGLAVVVSDHRLFNNEAGCTFEMVGGGNSILKVSTTTDPNYKMSVNGGALVDTGLAVDQCEPVVVIVTVNGTTVKMWAKSIHNPTYFDDSYTTTLTHDDIEQVSFYAEADDTAPNPINGHFSISALVTGPMIDADVPDLFDTAFKTLHLDGCYSPPYMEGY